MSEALCRSNREKEYMNVRMLFITILFLLNHSVLAFAEADKNSDKSSKQEKALHVAEQDGGLSVEKENLYELLYENSVASNNRVITTIQWSLGIISSFVLLFLGSQVFFNYRVNKEEVGAIRSESEERFSNLKSELLESIRLDSSSKVKEISSSFEKLSAELKGEVSKRVDEKEKYLDAKIESLQKDYSSLDKRTQSALKDIQIKNHNMEAEIWRLRGIEANALSRFVDQATMEIHQGKSPQHTLKEILNSLTAMEEVRTDICEEIFALSVLAKGSCEGLIAEIKDTLSKLPKYMFVTDPDNPGNFKTVYLGGKKA